MSVSKEFVLAGDAIFTIELPPGKFDVEHYTFRVQKTEANDRWDESWFVKMLTGPQNTKDYSYLGRLLPWEGQVELTRRSRMTAESLPFRLLNRILARIWAEDHTAYEQHGYKTHHEGKCGRCGRVLTVPESIKNGIGPECIKIMAGAA